MILICYVSFNRGCLEHTRFLAWFTCVTPYSASFSLAQIFQNKRSSSISHTLWLSGEECSCLVQIDLNYVKYFSGILSLRRCRASLFLAFCSALSFIACFLKEIQVIQMNVLIIFIFCRSLPDILRKSHDTVSWASRNTFKIHLQHNKGQKELFLWAMISVKVLLKVLMHCWVEWKWLLNIIIIIIIIIALMLQQLLRKFSQNNNVSSLVRRITLRSRKWQGL